MNEDEIRHRFKLSQGQPGNSFSLAGKWGPQAREKDNAQPVIPPPRTIFNPHPSLAPPGMMGSRVARPTEPKPPGYKMGPEPQRVFERKDENAFKLTIKNPRKSRGMDI